MKIRRRVPCRHGYKTAYILFLVALQYGRIKLAHGPPPSVSVHFADRERLSALHTCAVSRDGFLPPSGFTCPCASSSGFIAKWGAPSRYPSFQVMVPAFWRVNILTRPARQYAMTPVFQSKYPNSMFLRLDVCQTQKAAKSLGLTWEAGFTHSGTQTFFLKAIYIRRNHISRDKVK